MISKYIYINQLGVPCAPTMDIPLRLSTAQLADDSEYYRWSRKIDTAKQSAIPIREEDRELIRDIAGDFSTHFKLDTFYPVEPYEFEVGCESLGLVNTCSECGGDCYYGRAYIIRPSEPKADPKEKELYSIKDFNNNFYWLQNDRGKWCCKTPIIFYWINDYVDGTGNKRFHWSYTDHTENVWIPEKCESLEAGKLAAQQHFNSKLKLCLNREL